MHKQSLQTFSQVFLLFFLAILVSYGVQSLFSVPTEGDSLAYHIPIANSLLDGSIFTPRFHLGYYPSTAELILAVFMFLKVPLNLFNIVCLLLLFPAAKKSGERFGLQKDLATIFGITICLLPTMLRWTAAQIIDIWLLLFYVVCLVLLQKSQKTVKYFLLLGGTLGLLIGAKYSGPLFATGLGIVYIGQIRRMSQYMTYKHYVAFFVPMLLLGLSWYIRNTLLQHNPVYPQPLFHLLGVAHWNIFDYHEWEIMMRYPVQTFNAMFGEYLLWFLSPFVAGGIFLFYRHRLGRHDNEFKKLMVLGMVNMLIFLFLPTTPEYNIIVSSIRYSYPVFVVFILALFLYAQAVRKEVWIIVVSLSGLFFLPALSYRPKLLIIFFILLVFSLLVNKVIIKRR